MDISHSSPHPFYKLSNFAVNPFVIDGVEVSSMEGFLQSLKFRDAEKQKEVCALSALQANEMGENEVKWKKHQELWWNGRPYRRLRREYLDLLDRAYYLMMDANPSFATALKLTGDEELTHEIGEKSRRSFVITQREFCLLLTRLRHSLKPDLLNQERPIPSHRRLFGR